MVQESGVFILIRSLVCI